MIISLHGHHTINTILPSFMAHSDSSRWSPFISIHSTHFHHITLTNRINYHFLSFIQYHHCAFLSTLIPFRYTPIFILPHSHSLPYVISHYPHFFISSSFLFYSLFHSLLFSFSLSSHFFTSHITSPFSLSPLSCYSSVHSNHIPCLLSSSHLHHAHHLAYSSIIHPTSSSFHPPSIPSFSHFSLFHSSISPWCSSTFPQNSFSHISFIIPSYSLFHTPFHPIAPPSPSSPLIPAFHFHTHSCSLFIHVHPFPSHSSYQPLQSHSLLSISIPILSFHSISSFSFISMFSFDSSFSHVLWCPRPSLSIAHSFHAFIFSFIFSILCIPFISSQRLSSSFLLYNSIPCLFGYSLTHVHLLCW